jgi:hypothetical protein
MKNKTPPTPSLSPASTTGAGLTLSPKEIATRAEALWRKNGCPEGRDDEFWLEAERQLSRRPSPKGKRAGGALADPSLDPNQDGSTMTEELDDRFPDDTGKEPTSL